MRSLPEAIAIASDRDSGGAHVQPSGCNAIVITRTHNATAPQAGEPRAEAGGGRVQVLGHVEKLRPELLAHLTDEQRRLLQQDR